MFSLCLDHLWLQFLDLLVMWNQKADPFLGKGSWGLLGTALVAFLAVLALNWEAWCSKNIA
jgi:hypothetical protein